MKSLFLLVAALSWGDKFDPFLGPKDLRPIIQEACAETGVPVCIAAGLLWSESGGHQFEVTSYKDARGWHSCAGYWQLNRDCHDWFSRTFWYGADFNEFDPQASTVIALRYLAWLYEKEGVWWKAIRDYKHGPWAKKPASKGIIALCKTIANGGMQ